METQNKHFSKQIVSSVLLFPVNFYIQLNDFQEQLELTYDSYVFNDEILIPTNYSNPSLVRCQCQPKITKTV